MGASDCARILIRNNSITIEWGGVRRNVCCFVLLLRYVASPARNPQVILRSYLLYVFCLADKTGRRLRRAPHTTLHVPQEPDPEPDELCAESDWRVWRAARNASSVNGGRLPYSLGTVANAARTSQLNTARQTELPSDGFAPKVFTRKEGTMPRAPCLLCAASIPPHLPRSDDVEKATRGRLYTKALTHMHTGSCGRTSGQTKRNCAPSAFSQKQATRTVGRYLGTRPTTPS
jgi:hypothetical protein